MPIAGTASIFKLDNASAALTDISAKLKSLKFSRGAKTVDCATLGDTSEEPFGTLKNGTFSGDGIWDATIDAILDGGIGFNTRSFELQPAGTGSGLVSYTGECVITAYELSPSVDGVVPFTFSALVTGNATRALQS